MTPVTAIALLAFVAACATPPAPRPAFEALLRDTQQQLDTRGYITNRGACAAADGTIEGIDISDCGHGLGAVRTDEPPGWDAYPFALIVQRCGGDAVASQMGWHPGDRGSTLWIYYEARSGDAFVARVPIERVDGRLRLGAPVLQPRPPELYPLVAAMDSTGEPPR